MKNSILAILALAALSACKKNETTVIDSSSDSSMMVPATDSSMMPMDSATVSGTSTNLMNQHKMFADAAAKGGMMEVMLGETAEMNGMDAKEKL